MRLVGNILVKSGLDMAAEMATSILFQMSPEYWTLVEGGGGRAYLEFSEGVRGVFARRHIPNTICMLPDHLEGDMSYSCGNRGAKRY